MDHYPDTRVRVRRDPLGRSRQRVAANSVARRRLQVPKANVIAVFWTNSFIQVLDWLAAHGVSVTRTETDLGFKPLDALLP